MTETEPSRQTRSASGDECFPPEFRLRTQGDFRHVYNNGIRRGDGALLVIGALNSLAWTRIGLSVSRRHGNAVVRNGKKRRMREAFRRTRSALPEAVDLILIPRFRAEITVAEYADSLRKLSRRIARDLRRRRESAS